jgi:hypothetical protein
MLDEAVFRGSSAGGGARDLGAILELTSEASCGLGEVLVTPVELDDCIG